MRPTALNAILQRSVVNPGALGPFCHCEGFSVQCQKSVAAHVSRLLRLCSPSDITWFVIAILIWVSVDGMPCARARANVSEEGFKVISPFGGNGNTATTIVGEMCGCRIFAALNDSLPNLVLSRLRETVSGVADSGRIAALASAAFGVGRSKFAGLHYCDISTFTAAFPIDRSIVGLVMETDDFKTPKLPSGQVLEIVRNALTLGSSHEMFLSSEGRLWLEPVAARQRCPARFILADFSVAASLSMELAA